MSKPRPRKIICKWCGHSKSITKDLEVAYRKGRADAIDELKSNCITHILRERPLTLEEITNIIFFEAEHLKEFEK